MNSPNLTTLICFIVGFHCAWADDTAWIAARAGALQINLPNEAITILQYASGPKIVSQGKTLASFTENMLIGPSDAVVISPNNQLIRILVSRWSPAGGGNAALVCSLHKVGNDWVAEELQLPKRKPLDSSIDGLGAVSDDGATMFARVMFAYPQDSEGKTIYYDRKWSLVQYPGLTIIPNGLRLDVLAKH